MRFRILPKIHDFSDAKGNVYHPGDTVELPEEQYLGLPWLEPVEDMPIKVEAEAPPPEINASSRVESVEEAPPERRRRRGTPEIGKIEPTPTDQ